MSPIGFWRVVDANKGLFLCSSKIFSGPTVKTLDTVQMSPKSWDRNAIIAVVFFAIVILFLIGVVVVIFRNAIGKEQTGMQLGRAVHAMGFVWSFGKGVLAASLKHIITKMSPLLVIGSSQLGWE